MLGDRRGTHFTTRDLKSLGFHFCDTLLDYYDPDVTKVRDKAACLTTIYIEIWTPSISGALWFLKLEFCNSVFISVLFISDYLLSDRACNVVEKGGQREAGQRFGHRL